jgi:tetratricopeptide (TPR) repeat protein
MRDQFHRGLWVLALGILCLAGCSTSATRRRASDPSLPNDSRPAPNARATEVNPHQVTAYAHYAQAMIYDMDDEPELAQQELAKAALDDPSNIDLVLELTRRYLQQKQPEQALEILTRAVALPGATGELFARLAVVYSRLGKDDQAIQASQTAIKRSPNSLDGYRTLFFIYLQKGSPKDALKVLDQAAHSPDVSPEFGVGLVEMYATLERQAPSEKAAIDANALAALNRVAEQHPTGLQLRMKLADDYNLLGDTTNAERIYVQLLDANGDLPGLRDKLVDIYWREKNYNKAREQLEAMVKEDPANSKGYYLLGAIADDEKKFEEAADYFQKALLLSDDVEDLYYDLARVQINLNRTKDALDTLQRAKTHPKFEGGFFPEFLSALAYDRQKDFTNAINHFTAAEVIAKTTKPELLTGGFYFDQGSAYERAGNYDDAERCFQKSIQLAPDSPEALNYLGYMWAEHGIKLDKALELIEKAVRLEPKSAAYLDSLGWVLYKLNRPADALPNEQKAIEFSDEPDATLYDHLGDIYAALKQTDKARDAWTRSVALEPNEQVHKKLESVTSQRGH